jgi:putative ABC transport system permease protein
VFSRSKDSWPPGNRRSVRVADRVERDIDEELAFHIEQRVRDLIAQGRSDGDARRIALAEFGDLEASRRELAQVDRDRHRRERAAQWTDALRLDVRHAIRALCRAPSFTVAAVVTLAIGIASAVAIFAIINSVLLRPLPFKNPDRLVGVWHDFPLLGMTHGQQAPSTYFTYRTQARSIDGIGVYDESDANVAFPDAAGAAPQRMTTALVSATMFEVLGVSAARGRVFTEADDQPSAAAVMMISDAMWRGALGADPGVVGRRIQVNDVSREIIGVMPPSFDFPRRETQIWMPMALDPANPPAVAFGYNSVARLKPNVTIAEATREFKAVLPRAAEFYPAFVPGLPTKTMLEQVQPRPVLDPWRDDITGGIAETLWMLGAAAALLLVVACANVANLTLVRADAKQREHAVREALGAGRARVMRYFLVESALLAIVAGVFGTTVAWLGVHALVAGGPSDFPRLAELRVDWRTLMFASGLSLFAALACSIASMVRFGRRGALTLRGSSRGGTAGRGQLTMRNALVAAQIALSLVVLAGAGLLLRSFERLHAVRPGFDAAHVATVWTSLSRPRYPHERNVGQFYATLVERVARLPGVEAVGLTSRLPLMTRGANPNPLYPESDPAFANKLPPLVLLTTIGGDYFNAMRVPLLAGKIFEPIGSQRDAEAVISRRTAAMFWNDSTGRTVIGRRFRTLPSGPLFTVIGVVGDMRDSALASPSSPTVYFSEVVAEHPVRSPGRTLALVVRVAGDPTAVMPAVQRVIRELDPTLPPFEAHSMSATLRASMARLEFTIMMLGAAAIITLVLGAVGLYGVMAYIVALRRREIGIRIALGATSRGVSAAAIRHGMSLAGVGLAGGIVLFLAAAHFLRAFLFGVAPWDPPTIAAATLILLTLAIMASWLPARRAGRIDPAEVLRSES